jgi:hypothetical protein
MIDTLKYEENALKFLFYKQNKTKKKQKSDELKKKFYNSGFLFESIGHLYTYAYLCAALYSHLVCLNHHHRHKT